MKKLSMLIVVGILILVSPMSTLAGESPNIEVQDQQSKEVISEEVESEVVNDVTESDSVEPDSLVPEIPVIGDVTYHAECDIQEVSEIRYIAEDSTKVRTQPITSMLPQATMNKDSVIYMIDIVESVNNTDEVQWAKCIVDNTAEIYYIDFEDTKAVSEVGSGYVQPVPQVSYESSSNGGSSSNSVNPSTPVNNGGGNSRTIKITAYCSQCNSPRGSNQTASGSGAYIGSCAMKGLPFGTVVHTPYGDFVVEDRPGNDVLDIYVGDTGSCNCSSAGYHGVHTVTW